MVDWDFYCSDGMNSKKWTKIGVPSCWELQGFGHFNYGHDAKFNKKVYDEYGLYKHKFKTPKDWSNKTITIIFEGVMTDAEVKINGKLAGEMHQGAFYEFKYDISEHLNYGKENTLEVKVNKVSSNASINLAERNADFWIFGGIFRPVYLEVSPKDNVSRIAIDAKADGMINADIFTTSKKVASVNVFLSDVNGTKLQDLKIETTKAFDDKLSISTKADNILSWNPESPQLYNLTFELLDKKGNVLHKKKKGLVLEQLRFVKVTVSM